MASHWIRPGWSEPDRKSDRLGLRGSADRRRATLAASSSSAREVSVADHLQGGINPASLPLSEIATPHVMTRRADDAVKCLPI
jgi:hypothetical protein